MVCGHRCARFVALLCAAVPRAGAAEAEKAIAIESGDGSVRQATQALARAIGEGRALTGAAEPFHRIAIPYFKELGADVENHHLGRLVAELLAVELTQDQRFVVVERERLDQVMREHRLASLGLVEEATAAQFGKVLGAQSIISGTVGEAGTKYVVAIKQIHTETGRVLVAGQVEIERAGLVALSSDAVVLRSRTGAAFRSAVMPGWGQIYNDETVKGAAFLAAGAGTLATAVGFLISANAARSAYQENTLETVPEREVANRRVRTSNLLIMAFGVVWAINVVDAYLSGRDGTSVKLPGSGSTVSAAF